MKSWKTSLGGSIAGAGGALMGINLVPELKDIVPPEWKAKIIFIGFLLTVLGPVLLGLAARDNNVTSEDAGAKPPTNKP